MTYLPDVLLFISGICAGFGLAFTSTRTRTGNGIAGMAYIAAGLFGAMGLIAEIGW